MIASSLLHGIRLLRSSTRRIITPQAVELELGRPLRHNLLLVGHDLFLAGVLDGRLGGRVCGLNGQDGGLDPALDAAVAPVGDDGHGGGGNVGDAAAAEPAALAGDLDEEVGGDVAVGCAGEERGDVVDVGELLQQVGGGGEAAQQEADGGDGVVNLLRGHGVEEDEVGVGLGGVLDGDEAAGLEGRAGREDDAGGVEQRQLAVDLDLADARRDAGLGAGRAGLGGVAPLAAHAAEQRVDDGALADVGVADDADGDGALQVAAGGVALERLEERSRGALNRQVAVAKDVRVGGRVRRPHRQRGEVPAQVDEPVAQHLGRDQVDLVEDQDQALAPRGGGHDAALDLARAGAFRVAGVEHVEHHVGLIDDLLEDLVKRLAGRGLASGNPCAVIRGVTVAVLALVVVVFHVIVAGSERLVVLCRRGASAGNEGGHGVRLVNVLVQVAVLIHLVLVRHLVVAHGILVLVLALGSARLGGLCHFFPPLGLLGLLGALLLNLLQHPLLVGEQVGDAGVLLQLGAPFRVLLGQLAVFSLLGGRGLLDLVAEAGCRPLGLWFCAGFLVSTMSGIDDSASSQMGPKID
ncbi:hypothetical protein CCMA1212_003567 [Trichoderma ghanense]|uniref:Uncharacterized protein n=1 Tax=Trichoderma ghanense TaxID=65468 RepID=A0ABY2H7G3_9HYPO